MTGSDRLQWIRGDASPRCFLDGETQDKRFQSEKRLTSVSFSRMASWLSENGMLDTLTSLRDANRLAWDCLVLVRLVGTGGGGMRSPESDRGRGGCGRLGRLEFPNGYRELPGDMGMGIADEEG